MAKKRSFGQYDTAAQFRDIMMNLASQVIDRDRPRHQYATVDSIDRVTRTCMVTFTGDVTPVKVGMGSVQPMAAGQTVRIAGVRGDRFIDDVMGPVAAAGSEVLLNTLTSIGLREVTDSGTIKFADLTAWGHRGTNYLTGGTITISMPANGTVIPGVGGASNQTVAGSVINLAVGERLYYVPPWGTAGTSVAANFRIVGTTASYDVPDDWLFIVSRVNTYGYRWGTGDYDSEFFGTRSDVSGASATISNTYTDGGASVGVTVRWPPSGRGFIMVGARLKHVTAGEGVYASFQVRENDTSGTVVITTADNDGVYTEAASYQQISYWTHVGSAILVPGNKYFIKSMVRSTASAANATITARRIGFVPTD